MTRKPSPFLVCGRPVAKVFVYEGERGVFIEANHGLLLLDGVQKFARWLERAAKWAAEKGRK